MDENDILFIVDCWGVVQLGCLVPVGPAKVKGCKSFYLLKAPLKLKIKNSCFIVFT